MIPGQTLSACISDFYVSTQLPFVEQTSTAIQPWRLHMVRTESRHTNAIAVAQMYPNGYSLLAVDHKDDYGVSYGRLLFQAESLAEVNNFVQIHGGLTHEWLHFVSGVDIV